ncbi:flippase [Methanobrevibacter sp. TMH8]|uniref:flippase n=1 Tax=Methanobrevibacter sp. TMH8 TaxID=2848611 RepID=UPI001CCF1F8D|nr:flippase [Methanobrevibacter sp. TMH8]MBZ9570383.1 flippase [Methanobrevibacter sp. TMH8]
MSKLARGSFLILIGNIIFRFGGYIYRFLMAALLGPASYGILGLTLPFQGIFQVLAAGGLPPAIAKYVSQYSALEEDELTRQTIYTSLKIMIFLGLFFGLIMVFFVAPYLAYDFFSKPEALLPLQAVGLITPFSVIVGAFRGAFQGVYKMEYILYTRAVEQVFMILFATALVILGMSAFGAVLGSVIGFALSALSSVIIFKKYMWKYIPQPSTDFKFPLKKELDLAKQLVTFSIPVTVTALAEMAIYSVCTIIMGKFLVADLIGYFVAADPIARLPLIISTSIATTILPASSAAFSTKDQGLLNKYVSQAYKYGMILVVPICIGIAMFAKTIMSTVYFTNSDYALGAMALSILVIGMTFYSLFTISASIIQGIGNPRIPMYVLIGGTALTVVLGWFMIPAFGIEGGALATTISSFAMMIPILIITFRLTKVNPPVTFFGKLAISSAIMALFILLLPQNIVGLVLGIVFCPIIYFIVLTLLKTFTPEDIQGVRRFSNKLGPFSSLLNKILDIMGRFA